MWRKQSSSNNDKNTHTVFFHCVALTGRFTASPPTKMTREQALRLCLRVRQVDDPFLKVGARVRIGEKAPSHITRPRLHNEGITIAFITCNYIRRS